MGIPAHGLGYFHTFDKNAKCYIVQQSWYIDVYVTHALKLAQCLATWRRPNRGQSRVSDLKLDLFSARLFEKCIFGKTKQLQTSYTVFAESVAMRPVVCRLLQSDPSIKLCQQLMR